MVEVEGRRVGAEGFVMAGGSERVMPGVPGRERLMTSDQVLFLPWFPASLTFIGGGPVAMELASAYTDLGSRVTVLARGAEILPGVDPDVARILRKRMEAHGVTFRLQTTVNQLAADPAGVRIEFDSAGMANRMTSSQVCAAVGRRFHPRTIGAGRIGLELGPLRLPPTPYPRHPVPHH